MKPFMKDKNLLALNKSKIKYYTEWTLILVAHLLMLKWIMYALNNSGLIPTTQMIIHFAGLAIYGALLIRLCAFLAKRRYEKEQT